MRDPPRRIARDEMRYDDSRMLGAPLLLVPGMWVISGDESYSVRVT